MLRAPVLMRSIRKNNPKSSPVSKQKRDGGRDDETPLRPAFSSVCSLATELSVLITIKDQKHENFEGVFYKDDEDRFRQRYTLKLKTFSQYNVAMEIIPSLTITYLKIGGIRYDANMTKINKDDGKTVCSFIWSTNHIKTTQRKYRTILPCVIKFRGYRELDFEVLVKFYENEEVLHYTGVPLSSVGLYGTLSNDKQQKGQTYDIVFT